LRDQLVVQNKHQNWKPNESNQKRNQINQTSNGKAVKAGQAGMQHHKYMITPIALSNLEL
jgi:hypothetical protein